jgi:signal peptidase I
MDPTLKIGDRLAFTKTNAPDRGDIVIFWFPGHEPWQSQANTLYIKRCIARSSINSRVLEDHGLSQSDYLQISNDTYIFYLTEEEATKLRDLKFLKEVNISIASREQGEAMIYPPSMSLTWNPDFYGPIYVPKRGDKIDLTERSIDLYWNCIAFESNSAKRDASGVLIDGKRLETYEFKEDYFFMMGDNRHNSLDSRYWGLLPGSLVIGKAKYIYWGKTIDRIGKEII